MAAGQNNIVVIIAATDNSGAVLKQLEDNLTSLKGRANDAGDAVLQIGGKAAGLAALAAIAMRAFGSLNATVTGALNLGTELENMSKKTGLTVGTLSTLRYAATVTGNDFENVSKAVARLDKTIADAGSGNKQAQAVMASLGLNAKELASNSNGAEIALQALGKALANTSGPNQQALAMHAMGRGGAELIPVLIQMGTNWDYLRQKAMEAGVQLDGSTAAALAHSNRVLTDMKARVEGAGVAFTRGLAPGINAMLNVISSGKGNMDALVTFGHAVGRTMAVAESAAYGLAAGLFQIMAAGSSIGSGQMDQFYVGKAKEYDQKSRDAMYFAVHGQEKNPAPDDPLDKPSHPGTGRPGLPDTEGAAKMDSAIKERNASMAKLAEAQAHASYQMEKASADERLARLEEQHKQELVSDADFYARKLQIQRDALEAQMKETLEEQVAIDRNIAQLSEDAKKHGGRFAVDAGAGTLTLAKGKGGDADAVADEAKIADLLAKRLELTGQIGKIVSETAKVEMQSATDIYEMKKKQLTLSDELATKNEEASGISVSARLKQSADEFAEQLKPLLLQLDAANAGGDPDQIAAAQGSLTNAYAIYRRKQDSIRVEGAEEQYGQATAQTDAKRSAVDDAVARGQMTSLDAQREKIALDKEQADNLEKLQAAYQNLATEDNDIQAGEKVIELGTKIQELRNPVDEVAAHMREQFDDAFQGLFENLDKGKKEWQSFAKEIQKIVLGETYRMFIQPEVQQGLGRVFQNGGGIVPFAGGAGRGGAPSAAPAIGQALSASSPGLGKLPGLNPTTALGGGSPVTVQIINQTSSPAQGTASQQQGSDSSGLTDALRPHIIQVFLEDLSSNGVMGQALSGLGGLLAI